MKLYHRWKMNIYAATACQLALALVALWLTRFAFAAYNADSVAVGSPDELMWLAIYGLRFDLSATAYFCALFVAMRIVPFAFTTKPWYVRASEAVYGVGVGLMLAINVGDIPYYRFTGSRLRWSNIVNVTTDDNVAGIIGEYAGDYWWAFVGGAILIAIVIIAALTIEPRQPRNWPAGKAGLAARVCVFVAGAALMFLCMRGRLTGLPLAIGDAAYAVSKAPQINVALNSPFCILRSLNPEKSNREEIVTVMSSEMVKAVRSSERPGAPAGSLKKRNIVTIIIESGGSEWVDALSVTGTRRGLMPFLDSIARTSTVVAHTIATGRGSLGGATAVTMGFPAFDPFYYMLSPYNKNVVDSPARLLDEKGWDTAFYYGCKPGSFNIDQTARASGYSRTVDKETYGNDNDYDGVWGIYDYPMAEYIVNDLCGMSEPFAAAWFTVSAHGPFNLPENWDTSRYRHPERSPERGLEYTDEALRHFFELASRQPWYDNTTFIITADHGNRDFKGTPYDSDYIRHHIPFVIYTPDGSVPPRLISDRVASQCDIAATTLGLVGYDSPYVSIGADVLADDFDGYGIARSDGGRYLVVGPRHTIYVSPDLKSIESVYDTAADPVMTAETSLTNEADSVEVERMLKFAQAFMCDYTERLNHDRLSLRR